MLSKKSIDGSVALVLCTLGLFGVLLTWGMVSILALYFGYSSEVADIKPKLARLQGLISIEDQLAEAVLAVDGQLSDLAFGADLDSSKLTTQVQQQSRTIFRDSGMVVTGSQVSKIIEEGGLAKIGVSLTLEGSLGALEAALLEVAHARPLMIVDEVEISPERRHRNSREQNLEVSIKLFCLQLRENDES